MKLVTLFTGLLVSISVNAGPYTPLVDHKLEILHAVVKFPEASVDLRGDINALLGSDPTIAVQITKFYCEDHRVSKNRENLTCRMDYVVTPTEATEDEPELSWELTIRAEVINRVIYVKSLKREMGAG